MIRGQKRICKALYQRLLARPAENDLGLLIPFRRFLPNSLIWINPSSAPAMMSCAMRSLSCSNSWAFLLAPMSRALLAAAKITAPDRDFTGETLSETSIRCPALFTRTVLVVIDVLVVFDLAQVGERLVPRFSRNDDVDPLADRLLRGESEEINGRPNSGPMMRPSRSLVTIASLDDSTAAMNSCSRSAYCRIAASSDRCCVTSSCVETPPVPVRRLVDDTNRTPVGKFPDPAERMSHRKYSVSM